MPPSTSSRLLKLRALSLSLALAAGLGLAACGGGDDDSGDGSSTTSGSADIREQFDQLLQQNLTGAQGLNGDVADCVVSELQQSVSDEQIQQVIDTGQLSPEVTKAAQAAGLKCAQEAQGG
jgi:hypothetical protein